LFEGVIMVITKEMIHDYLGHNKDGCQVKIKRNTNIYRQLREGGRWQYYGEATQVARELAELHGLAEWEIDDEIWKVGYTDFLMMVFLVIGLVGVTYLWVGVGQEILELL